MPTTFPHPCVTKSKFLQMMQEFYNEKQIIQRYYSSQEGEKFKGCSIGCGIQIINNLTKQEYNHSNHEILALYLGIPEEITWFNTRVFEGLSLPDATNWAIKFIEAIPEGADVEPAIPRILFRTLKEIVLPSVILDNWGVEKAIKEVCYMLECSKTLEECKEYAEEIDLHSYIYCAYCSVLAVYNWVYDKEDDAKPSISKTLHAASAALSAYYIVDRPYDKHPDSYDPSYDAENALGIDFDSSDNKVYPRIAEIILEELRRCGE